MAILNELSDKFILNLNIWDILNLKAFYSNK